MTLVKYSGLVDDMRGILGGSILSKVRSGNTIKSFRSPVNRSTSYQYVNRLQWQYLISHWSKLSQLNRDSWNSLALVTTWTNKVGKTYHPSGQQLFLYCNQNLFISGNNLIDAAVAPSVLPLITSVSVSEVFTPLYELLLTFSPAPTDLNLTYRLYASPCLSQGIEYAKKQLKLIDNLAGNTRSPYLISPQYINRFKQPKQLSKIFFKLLSVEKASGFSTIPIYFNLVTGSGHAFIPTDISGCVLWFSSDQGIIKNGSNFISKWSDLSGNNNDLLQSNTSNQPLFIPSALNGKPAVEFDGIRSFLSCVPFPLVAPNNFFMVFKTRRSSGVDILFSNNNANEVMFYLYLDNNIICCRAPNFIGGLNLTVDTFYITEFLLNGSSSFIRVGDSQLLNGDPGGNNMNGLYLGAQPYQDYFGMTDFCEFICYNNNISDVNRTTLINYLKVKYNLT